MRPSAGLAPIGAVAHVVAHVVGDGGGVARVVLRDAGLHFADQVGADVGSLGEDAATDSQEQRQQRATEAEADEDDRAGVLEHHDDGGGAQQAEADGEHAGDAAGAERNGERPRQAVGERSSGGAHVAASGQGHADVAGEAGGETAQDESQRPERTGLHERQRGLATRLDDLGAGEEHDGGQGHEDDGDRLELALQVGGGAFLDGLGDLLHLGRAFVLGHHQLGEEQSDCNGDESGYSREEENGPLAALQLEYLIAAFGNKCWHR